MSGSDARYARQMIMPQIGSEGQHNLSDSKVLIVGAGGIGSTVAMYLAASGVPADVLDFDVVEVSNLHRYVSIVCVSRANQLFLCNLIPCCLITTMQADHSRRVSNWKRKGDIGCRAHV